MFNNTKLALALGSVLALVSANTLATLSVTTSNDANVLANEILGSGITINSASYTGATSASGSFTGDTVFGLDSGLVMTTGSALTAADATNDADATTTEHFIPGDTDLDTLIDGGSFTADAAVLVIDFTFGDGTLGGNSLFFNWVFASEEYNEFVDSQYNDVFGFFLDGINIAKAPDGQVASINTINCGGNGQDFAGPNCSSYNNNDLQDGGPFFNTEYDGFTDVITATASGLGAGIHTIKIAIADVDDYGFDSAVFIEVDTFSNTGPSAVSEPGILALLGIGLAGMTLKRRRKLV